MQAADTTSSSRTGAQDTAQRTLDGSTEEVPPVTRRWSTSLKLCLLACLQAQNVLSLPAQNFSPDQCYSLAVSESPLWMTSGVFADTTAPSLLWVDAARQEVQEVTLEADSLRAAVAPTNPTWMPAFRQRTRTKLRVDIQGPASIWRTDSGYHLEFKVPAEMLHVDGGVQRLGAHSLTASAAQKGNSVLAVFNLSPMAGGYLAFGDIVEAGPPDPPNSAFFYFEPSGRLDIFETIPATRVSRNQYTRNYLPFLAAIDNDREDSMAGDKQQQTGYVLLLEERPQLATVKPGWPGLERLPDFPKDFQTRPSLEREPALRGQRIWEQETKWFRTLEQADLAAGLYARDNSLFLLGKKMEDQKPGWWLVKLNPATGGAVFKRRIPTDAAHLTVIPGDRYWAFVEKGRVKSITNGAPFTRIKSLVLVPATWLESEDGGRLDSKRRVHCVGEDAHPK